MKILAGDAHPQLARDIAEQGSWPLVPSLISSFADGETRVRIEGEVRCEGASRVSAVIPYFGYARQDVRGASCVVVDDMASTGRTIAGAARADRRRRRRDPRALRARRHGAARSSGRAKRAFARSSPPTASVPSARVQTLFFHKERP